MSVVNRIEIANFLSLNNRNPSDSDWRPGHIHTLINCRGQSTAIIATNGLGKTTINMAIYTILARDRGFATFTRSVMAPKRHEAYSHVRIEILYRDKPAGDLFGRIGAEVPGEPYVLGVYGNADTELSYYYYQGTLEDCPVAVAHERETEIVANQRFRGCLKDLVKSEHSNPPRQEWVTVVGRHFDQAMIGQLVQYQKAGGGDSNGDFFRVTRTRSDGRQESYDGALFYEYIAPEVLAKAMEGFGKQDEVRFEDTILESAKPIIETEIKHRKAQAKLKVDEATLRAVEGVHDRLRQFTGARRELDGLMATLTGEVAIILDITHHNPLPGVPVELAEGSEANRRVANGLVLSKGEWMVPDRLLAALWEAEAKEVNRTAERHKIPSTTDREVVEIYCHLASDRFDRGGHPNRLYSLGDALALTDKRTVFPEGRSRDDVKRALNDGYRLRSQRGEPNPLRPKLIGLKSDSAEFAQEKIQIIESISDLERRQQGLIESIQSVEADELELQTIRESDDFTPGELEDLAGLGQRTNEDKRNATRAREEHQQRHARQSTVRAAYARFRETNGDAAPADRLSVLTADRDRTAATFETSKAALADADTTLHHADAEAARVSQALSELQEKNAEMRNLRPAVELYAQVFRDEVPSVTLVEAVNRRLAEAQELIAGLRARIPHLASRQDQLSALAEAWTQYRDIFVDRDPVGLEMSIVTDLTDRRSRLARIDERDLPGAVGRLETLHQGLATHDSLVDELEVDDLDRIEGRLIGEREKLTANREDVARESRQAEEDRTAVEAFRRTFGNRIPEEVRSERRAEYRRVGATLDDAERNRADLQRQLQELDRTATAAGRVANEALRTVSEAMDGGRPMRVHEVITSLLPDSAGRRPAVMTHFSHVLHAPVVDDLAMAERVLSVLDKAGVEYPVFWKPELEAFCLNGDVSTAGAISTALLAGQRTLQVEGILDPAKIEERRRALRESLTRLEDTVTKLSADHERLAETSEEGALVRRAGEAVARGLYPNVERLQEQLSGIGDRLSKLELWLSDPFVARLREAQTFIDQGGRQALVAIQQEIDSLHLEYSELEAAIRLLEEQADAIPLIRKAVTFVEAGGQDALERVREERRTANEQLAAATEEFPRLRERAEAVPAIRGRIRFDALGGSAVYETIATDLERLAAERRAADAAREQTAQRRKNATAARDVAEAKATEAALVLASNEGTLRDLVAYVGNGDLAFDETFADVLEDLRRHEDLAVRRAGFRFESAARALANEGAGRTAETMRTQHRRVSENLVTARHWRDHLERRLEAIAGQIAQLVDLVKAVDAFAAWATRKRLQAHELIVSAGVGLDGVQVAKRSAKMEENWTYLSERRTAIEGEMLDETLVAELESIKAVVEEFQFNALESQVSRARSDKDRAWRDYIASLDRLTSSPDVELSDQERGLLSEATFEGGAHRIEELFRSLERHVVSTRRKAENLERDLEAQNRNLQDGLKAFTLNASDNLRLLKRCLRPSKPGEAGFTIDAIMSEDADITNAVAEIIDAIRFYIMEQDKRSDANRRTKSQAELDRDIKREIKDLIYRGVFLGPVLATGERDVPRVLVEHASIGEGRRMRFTEKISTGQRNALGLLLMTKLADFAIRRDEQFDVAGLGRKKSRTPQTRMVMIDGLFSNISNRRLIRDSLRALKELRGRFQLIGWIHNEYYENDPEIFPSCVALRQVGREFGFIVSNEWGTSADAGRLEDGQVSPVEIHVDSLPEEGDAAVVGHPEQELEEAD